MAEFYDSHGNEIANKYGVSPPTLDEYWDPANFY